ncbi:MAG: hypothetical protein ACPGQL_00745 [Thermoplasmatota archaeon]
MDVVQIPGGYEVRGDTYLVKDILKKHGARWNGMAGAWTFDDEAAAHAAAKVASTELAYRKELEALEAMA